MTTPSPDPDPADPVEAARLEALEEALDLMGDDRFDETSFRRRHPEHADGVLDEVRFLREIDSTRLRTPAQPDASAPPLAGPTKLGEFEIEEEIGRGGMGIVYRAHQAGLDRMVAVKVLPPGFAATAELRERFEREAAMAARLSHPAIVRVYSFGADDGFLYLAMEWIDGGSLHHVLRSNPDRTREELHAALDSEWHGPSSGGIRGYVDAIVDIGIAVADALSVAHDHGLIHRDVKPANILLDRDARPHLADFGLAREAASQSLTASGHLLGTPSYIAPECIDGAKASAQSDVFALGATLYEALTNRVAFEGETSASALNRVLHHDPPPVDRIDGRLPADLANVVQRAIEKEPHRRYSTAAELREDLIRFRDGEAVLASRVGLAGRAWRRARRRPAFAGTVVALVLLAIAIATYAVVQNNRRGRDRAALATRLLTRGAAFEANGEFEAARTVYREAIESAGETDRAKPALVRIERAIALRDADRLEDILVAEFGSTGTRPILEESVGDRVRRLPEDDRGELLRAIHDLLRRQPDAALQRVEAQSGLDPIAADFIRARALWMLGRGQAAHATRARALAVTPETRLATALGIADRVGAGLHERALAMARTAERKWPASAAIPFFLGETLGQLNRNREAREYLSKAIGIDPDFWRAYIHRGYACLPVEVAAFDEAERDFQRVKDAIPESTQAVRGLARIWCTRPATREKGFALLDTAIENHPDDALLRLCRGELLAIDPSRYDDAEIDLERAVEIAHTDRTITSLVSFYMRRRKLDDALALIQTELANPRLRDAARATLFSRRAQLRLRDDPQQSAADFRAAIAIRRDPEFVHGLAALNFGAANFARAESLFQELVEAGYRGRWAVIHRAICRFSRLDVDRAFDELTDATGNLHGLRTEAPLYYRAFVNFATDRMDDAIRAARRLRPTRQAVLIRLWFAFEVDRIDGVADEIDALDAQVDAPELDLARAWVLAARGKWAEVRDVEIPGVTRAWCLGYHGGLIEWGRAADTPDAVRRQLQTVLTGRFTLETVTAIPEQSDATHEALRQLLVGLARLDRGERADAIDAFEASASGLGDPVVVARLGVLHALEGNGAEAAHFLDLARQRRMWREALVTIAFRAGVRRGLPEVDAFFDGDRRGL